MLARWVALGAVTLVVGACGGKVAKTSGEDADGTGGEVGAGGAADGGDATGGTATGGAATGGVPNPMDCPAYPPMDDTACSFGGGECHYVTADKGCCEEAADASCVDGRWSLRETDCDCPVTCPAGLILCGDVCTDVTTDPENCGACGVACLTPDCGACCVDAGPAICSAGICTSTCGSGMSPCGGYCVDFCTSQLDCGACGVACPAGEACVGGACVEPDWYACEGNEDCQIAPATCCGACGAYTSDDVVAVHRAALAAYSEAACAGVEGCPTCEATRLPSITARCAAGRCEVVDLSKDDLTACAAATDCVLRTQACCECDAPSEYVALGSAMGPAYAELVCLEGQVCPECEHEYPASLAATCDAGHCLVSF
ncbi:MAG TPA: hypothetical protein PLU22_00115 [Polyangiaceae bacterium]|nr:hypothetical protein [Polyangiaceae bacterium]